MSDNPSWSGKLNQWLAKNPKVIPDDLRQLREEFVRRFPKGNLGAMTLQQYALGHDDSPNSFCQWLEYRTKKLGGMGGGNVKKHGVWWDKKTNSWRWNQSFKTNRAEDALAQIKQGLVALVAAVEEKEFDNLDEIGARYLGPFTYSLRTKPLYLYYPEEFLPINKPAHLRDFLHHFGEEPKAGPLACNRQLLSKLRILPEFDGFDTCQMMKFLYDCLPHGEEAAAIGEDARNVWKVAPGRKAKFWEQCQQVKRIVVGWLENSDFRDFKDKNDVAKALAEAGDKTGGAHSIWPFTHEIEKGHLIVANKGQDLVVGVGIVKSDYIPPSDERNKGATLPPHHRHSRDVDWLITKEVKVPFNFLQPTVTPLSIEQWQQIKSAYRSTYPDDPKIEEALRKLGKALKEPEANSPEDRGPLQKLRNLLTMTHNLILYGPPGCGKTYWARRLGIEFTSKERCEFVTFHQSFAYEEFVEGLKPCLAAEGCAQIKYEVRHGVFRKICDSAAKEWSVEQSNPPKYLLVIDEINRANIAKVFGELITLIEHDKRLGEQNPIEVTLPYSGDKFGVPPNLYILGTMNTADRSIALLDLALRRRFTFLEIMPDASLLKPVEGVDLGQLLKRLNERIVGLLDRDHQIGHSYFLLNGGKAGPDELHFTWYRRVIPLLQEYFYNDGERLRAVLGADFVRRVEIAAETSKALGDVFDREAPYEVVTLEGEQFFEALRRLTGTAAEQTNMT